MAVRDATSDDIPALVELGREYHAASLFKALPFDADRLALSWDKAISDGRMLCLVAEADTGVVGLLAAMPTRLPWSDAEGYADVNLFVSAAHRGAAAVALVNEMHRRADDAGMRFIVVSPVSGYRHDELAALMERKGYAVGGRMLVRV